MQPPYSNYQNYYSQSVYQQTPHNGYASIAGSGMYTPATPTAGPSNPYPYFGTHTNTHNIQPPTTGFDPSMYSAQPTNGAITRPSKHGRSKTIGAPQSTPGPPLKSALKKSKTTHAAPSAVQYSTSQEAYEAFVQHQQQQQFQQQKLQQQYQQQQQHQQQQQQYQQHQHHAQNGISRSRTYSNPRPPVDLPNIESTFTAYHMFISFHGFNELRLENVTQLALSEIRNVIWPMWEDGIESDVVEGHNCIVKFRSAPWDMGGPNILLASKLIVALFQLCAQRGYACQTSVNTGTPKPRLVFQVTVPDLNSRFFLAYLSRGGRRLTLVNPPNHIDLSLGAQLKAVLPRNIATNDAVDDDIRVIEVKGNAYGGGEVEPAFFLMHVLRIIDTLGFQLDASIPLARRGSLGFRKRRELLVFKGSNPG